ncbi:MAG: addiction module antidote protein [Bryobacteraceae bacterium]|jgi:probable addiction module antidote protein
MPKGYRDYEESLGRALKDPKEAAAYLSACLEGGSREAFLLALRQVAAAHGVALVAERSRLGRESLYRTLSGKGNPTLATLMRLLDAAGLKLSVAAKRRARRAA